MQHEFYSNGKLLISGEYAILDGAKGLALPTKYGQSLQLKATDTGLLHWKSFNANGKQWFESQFDLPSLEVVLNQADQTTEMLQQILRSCKVLNPDFLTSEKGLTIETHLTFPKDWGLGTSSTLINSIANWAKVDAYKLLGLTFGGSGYDIACAQHNQPLTYKLGPEGPEVELLDFNPVFKDQLFFVYLNQKRNSREAIAKYRNTKTNKSHLVETIASITSQMITCSQLSEFEELMTTHEELLSKVLAEPTVKSHLFGDYPGEIKSLGAWGGDFVLVTGPESYHNYFRNKGYSTILRYSEMILGQ